MVYLIQTTMIIFYQRFHLTINKQIKKTDETVFIITS
jgi:hypothetical protein